MDKEQNLPSDNKLVPKAWYAIAWSNDCKKKPIKRKLAGQEFVLFRDRAGQIKAVPAYCSHRGADLSLGKVTGDCIQCPYHGWEFSGTGTCKRIPSHPDRAIPDFAHIQSFPVCERAQIIWIYPESGLSLVPEFNLFPILNEPRFAQSLYHCEWQAHLTRVAESVLDVAHLAFVHKQTIGKHQSPHINDLTYQVEDDDFYFQKGNNRFHYRFPQMWIQYIGEPQTKLFTFVTFTPIDDNKTLIFNVFGRSFAKRVPGISKYMAWYGLRVLKEDQLVVESQHPRPIPEALRMEAHVASDVLQVRFRQRWYQFLETEEQHLYINQT